MELGYNSLSYSADDDKFYFYIVISNTCIVSLKVFFEFFPPFWGLDEAQGRRPTAELDVAQGRAHHQGLAPEPPERSAERTERSLPLRSQEVQVLLRAQSDRILSGKCRAKI